ncbi:efflux RND transporter periplasmic adaptor subunit [Paraglaciecola aquimarina]|uniref:Efflux RND transporter periplasmic adaptor subunit n=1 Tax=Paraglaciecola algarum TaxID=3050085 RepID=A0ABS9D1X4_9ALTE|nr:efflux RND transporter periplasmic adaptor subunit [Paraglaciecola sp. G1-23]MCF2946908.1 efflux RND transporter periplasmic adaptor subunit [Paraglaciecola sp. G1-23]
MSNTKKWLLPLIIIIVTAVAANFILNNPPESRRGGPSNAPQMTVDVQKLTPQEYTVVVDSYGTVEPTTQSDLVAQVSGQITYVSPQFRNGGFFNKGDVLVKLDQRDYLANVKIAEAGLLSAQQALLEEQANSKQAAIDWERLGNGKQASDLVLRKPQLEAAKASLLSAEASLTRAQLALERTQITAPYDGRILSQLVDYGQVISSNSKIAEIFSTDSVEIRLPINNSDIDLVNFPEEFKTTQELQNVIEARFSSSLTKNQNWLGRIVRTEAAIDSSSQQLYIVAQIADPYNPQLHPGSSIKIGQYVSAEVQGKTINNAIVIANSAIYQGSYVYIVEDGLLLRKDIKIRWQNDSQAIIEEGLLAGENLVITPLGQVSSGTPVIISGERPQRTKPSNNSDGRLVDVAKRMGISVEELKAKRQAGGGKRPNGAPKDAKASAEPVSYE